MTSRHVAIHLRLIPERDLQVHHLKRRKVNILKLEHGGSYCGDTVPDALCGVRRASRLVGWKERERVTCSHCKRLILVRLVPESPS